MQARLTRDYRPRYRKPVAFTAGETLVLGVRDVDWPEFIWATDARGRSGWVHQGFLDGDRGIRDYDAREMEANAGDQVRLIESAGGWWWVENAIGECGWLPERDLAIEPGIK
ncbi:SH3 domain-containing protein [Arenimonas daejeonensis]|uniref:SH3 domain-containing protein n=1 Tax=Arenimonas daejeonensis TaxID=370777 RepID=UPI0011BDE52D|nr:SH3 domain-containing protein [Arenimonas daejeonensis]